MAGGITRGRLFREFRPDLRALSVVRRAGAGQDDRLLQAVAAEFESEGITIAPSTLFLDDLLAPAGKLGKRSPTQAELQDIDFGFQIAKEIGALDIGQTVVVRHHVVVALEAVEGTDACIRRAGALAGPGTVVVKTSKPNQDLRFDVPAVGLDTIQAMTEPRPPSWPSKPTKPSPSTATRCSTPPTATKSPFGGFKGGFEFRVFSLRLSASDPKRLHF